MQKSYGIHGGDEGLVPWAEVEARLESSRNYWIGTTRADGKPHAMPVWGVWTNDALVFGTDKNSRKARNIARQADVTLHLESGDDVVIIEGAARTVTNKSEIAAIDILYQKKYAMKLTDAPGELFVCAVEPRVVFAWHERDYPKSATRFRF
jgi:nitroimidazol reductase NimA-like FMN-containing flavoprotein (pyridoxamine 5'-phosphate oxidase superfamily)